MNTEEGVRVSVSISVRVHAAAQQADRWLRPLNLRHKEAIEHCRIYTPAHKGVRVCVSQLHAAGGWGHSATYW